MSNSRRNLILIIAIIGLASLACNTLSVSNQSKYKVLVSVILPGASGADSHVYEPGEVFDYYPETGGSFTISVIPQEDYIAEMDRLRAQILLTLYGYQTVINPSYVVELTEDLARIDRTLSSLTTHSCTGNMMDDSNVMATINIAEDGEIKLYCPSLGRD